MTKARDIASAAPAPSTVSATELGYLDGVSSAIQTQIDSKAAATTAVTLTGSETLTNKTLTSPTVNTPTLTLSTTTSSTDGRIAWDSTNDKIIVGDGSTTKEFAQSTLSYNAQSGTTYTFVLTDKDKMVTANNASAQSYTIPPNSSVAFPVGTQINIIQIGAGQVTINIGSGVTIVSTGATVNAPKLRVQYSAATLIKRDTDTWYVVGDIA